MQQPSPSSSSSRRWLVALALAAALLLGACGRGADVTVDAAQSGAAPAPGALPTLPPLAVDQPGRFDAAGCAVTADGSDCAVRAADLDAARAGASDADWRALAGFVGPRWATEGLVGDVVVLTDTVTAGTGPSWTATGLVRNERPDAVGDVVVTAELLAGDATVLGRVQAPVAVTPLRSGEPAPFALAADVDTAAVASVHWSATATTAPTAAGRDLELTTYWQRSPGDTRPVDVWLYTDPADGSRPLVVFGGATNVGGGPLADVRLVGAWLDASGRVVAVTDALVGRPGETVPGATATTTSTTSTTTSTTPPVPSSEATDDVGGPGATSTTSSTTSSTTPSPPVAAGPTLAPGEAADTVLVLDPATVPAGLVDARLVLWGMGS